MFVWLPISAGWRLFKFSLPHHPNNGEKLGELTASQRFRPNYILQMNTTSMQACINEQLKLILFLGKVGSGPIECAVEDSPA